MPAKKEYAFVCEVCGAGMPKSEYWRMWGVMIGNVCKPCRLIEISQGVKR